MNPLTERDVKLLQFINEFGFCELRHLMKRFSLRSSNAYKIMKRLCRHDLIIHERIYLRKPGVYRLSKLGASYTDLPALDKVPNIKYDHQLKVIDVFMKLAKEYPGGYWVSERRLLIDQNQKDILKRKHIADGMLLFEDGREIAIEVELSLKGKNRLEKILKAYAGQYAITEVWYYCWPYIIPALKKQAEKRSFVKIHNLTEFLV